MGSTSRYSHSSFGFITQDFVVAQALGVVEAMFAFGRWVLEKPVNRGIGKIRTLSRSGIPYHLEAWRQFSCGDAQKSIHRLILQRELLSAQE